VDDDIQDLWHAPSKPKVQPRPVIAPRPIAPRPVVSNRPVPALDCKVGDRVTINRGGRDRTAIVRYFSDGKVVVDLDPVPITGPVGGYQGIRVEPHAITRILPKPPMR
jgi:hypothetical protein